MNEEEIKDFGKRLDSLIDTLQDFGVKAVEINTNDIFGLKNNLLIYFTHNCHDMAFTYQQIGKFVDYDTLICTYKGVKLFIKS